MSIIAGLDVNIRTKTPLIDHRCTALTRSKMLNRSAGKNENVAKYEKAVTVQFKIVWHGFRRPLWFELGHRNVTKNGLANDASPLEFSRLIFQTHRDVENMRDSIRGFGGIRRHHSAIGHFDDNVTRLARSRLYVIMRPKIEKRWILLRARDSACS